MNEMKYHLLPFLFLFLIGCGAKITEEDLIGRYWVGLVPLDMRTVKRDKIKDDDTVYVDIYDRDEKTLFDYSGCFYPQGLVSENVFYFNHENIDKVVLKGLKMKRKNDFKNCFVIGRKKTWEVIKKE